MSPVDHSVLAAAVVDELISRADDALSPIDRDPLRTVLRIGLELETMLGQGAWTGDALQWAQETVCAGCEYAMLSRNAWRLLGQFEGMSLPGPGADTFPADLSDLRRMLAEALGTVLDSALPLAPRLRALNRVARLQIIFLGATLW